MAIILYSKKKFHGNAISVNNDVADLKDSGLKGAPSSPSITAAGDRLLLFKSKDFDGACLFRQCKAQIEDLGDNDAGGKIGFGNTIASVRLNAFSVDINATFIKKAGGELPGGLAKTKDAEHLAEPAVIEASRLWEPFLMRLKLTSVEFQTDDMHFDVELDRLVRFPLSFYKKNHVNVFFINSFRKALGHNATGLSGRGDCFDLNKRRRHSRKRNPGLHARARVRPSRRHTPSRREEQPYEHYELPACVSFIEYPRSIGRASFRRAYMSGSQPCSPGTAARLT